MSTPSPKLMSAIAAVARTAHIPQVAPIAGGDQDCRYFGQPWLPSDVAWPVIDDTPLEFVLQLNTSQLPAPWGVPEEEAKLILFFYSADINEHAVLAVDPRTPGELAAIPEGVQTSQALTITGWKPVLDYPWTEDFEEVFEDLADDISELVDELDSSSVGTVLGTDGKEYSEQEALEKDIPFAYHCFECDKLGGWPRWEQGNDMPAGEDGNDMNLLMQVAWEGLLLGEVPEDTHWPTWGRGQIFISDSTGELEYVWACD